MLGCSEVVETKSARLGKPLSCIQQVQDSEQCDVLRRYASSFGSGWAPKTHIYRYSSKAVFEYPHGLFKQEFKLRNSSSGVTDMEITLDGTVDK